MKAKLDAEETADRLPATEIRSLWKCARQFLQRLGTSACLGTSMKEDEEQPSSLPPSGYFSPDPVCSQRRERGLV